MHQQTVTSQSADPHVTSDEEYHEAVDDEEARCASRVTTATDDHARSSSFTASSTSLQFAAPTVVLPAAAAAAFLKSFSSSTSLPGVMSALPARDRTVLKPSVAPLRAIPVTGLLDYAQVGQLPKVASPTRSVRRAFTVHRATWSLLY